MVGNFLQVKMYIYVALSVSVINDLHAGYYTTSCLHFGLFAGPVGGKSMLTLRALIGVLYHLDVRLTAVDALCGVLN